MPNGPMAVVDNAPYHVRVRGNGRRNVFLDDQDKVEYLARLRYYKRRYSCKLFGYCLMPNHVHIVGFFEKYTNLSKFMHGLSRSYTAYFNQKYDSVGHLWQGRFKSNIISVDQYLHNVISYVEHNPVRAKLVATPDQYLWSSYRERCLGIADHKPLIDPVIL